jgi:hypothetical protein
MKPSSITTLAALLVIGAGGFIAGRISSNPGGTAETSRISESRLSRGSSADSGSDSTGPSSRKVSRSERAEKPAKASLGSPEERLAKLEEIVRGENALDRNRALLAFIDQLAPGDFENVIDSFRKLGITQSRMGEYSLLLTAWAEADPMAALAYAKENTGTRFATNTIISTWASNDAEGAIRWALANHEGDGANPYMAGIIQAIAGTDPNRATQLLTSMPRSQERGEALDQMLPHLLKQGGDATRSWIDGLQDDALRNGAMMRAADQLAATDPAGTAAWLLANPGEATDRRMDDVYSTWAAKDESAALAAMANLPAGEVRSDALRGVISSVAVRDPQAAVSMLDRYQSDVDDRVVRNVVWHSFGADPALAMNQIARINDQGDRERMYARSLEAWMDRDATAANAWLQQNTVPDSVIQRLQRRQNEQQRQ